MNSIATFAAVFATLYAAHSVGDHWVQTHGQACTKGAPNRAGQVACLKHVATLTATKLAFLGAVMLFAGLAVHPLALTAGLTVDAVSHYWADRRYTLARFAALVGKGDFYRLGLPEAAPTGTGSYALDQSWHHLWIFIAALISAGGS